MVPLGTKVYLMNDPVKVAFLDGQLLLEVHPPVDAQGQTVEPELSEFERLLEPLADATAAIDWDYVRATLKLANGIPVTVGLEADRDATLGDTHSPSSNQQ
jgi:L,D-transpeptidase ErfK/SrfK